MEKPAISNHLERAGKSNPGCQLVMGLLLGSLLANPLAARAAEHSACPNEGELRARISSLNTRLENTRNSQILEMRVGSEYNRANNPDGLVIAGLSAATVAALAVVELKTKLPRMTKDAIEAGAAFMGLPAIVVGGTVIADQIAPQYDDSRLKALMKQDERLMNEISDLQIQLKGLQSGQCLAQTDPSVMGASAPVAKSGGLLATSPSDSSGDPSMTVREAR